MFTLGIALVVLGAALAVAEAHVPSYGALGAAAVAALAGGVALLVAGAGLSAAAVLGAAGAAAAVGVALVWLIVVKALVARRGTVRAGRTALIGRTATVRSEPAPLGHVLLDGTLWRARLWELDGEPPLREGDTVVVERVDGLTLTVRPAEEWEVLP